AGRAGRSGRSGRAVTVVMESPRKWMASGSVRDGQRPLACRPGRREVVILTGQRMSGQRQRGRILDRTSGARRVLNMTENLTTRRTVATQGSGPSHSADTTMTTSAAARCPDMVTARVPRSGGKEGGREVLNRSAGGEGGVEGLPGGLVLAQLAHEVQRLGGADQPVQTGGLPRHRQRPRVVD